MKRLLVVAVNAALVMVGLGCSGGAGSDLSRQTATVEAAGPRAEAKAEAKTESRKKAMRAFASEQELKTYLRELAAKQNSLHRAQAFSSYDMAAPAAAPKSAMASVGADSKEESVTNVQHAGVDEGGIVKVHGDHLVVLHRGRLFTVAIGGNELTPISIVDAFGPDIDPRGTWYDEMLVSQDTVVVIGYSYERGGTEVGLFRIDPSGLLAYRSTYHLRSNDYYSSRNYASRLIGNKLIFYSPMYLYPGGDDPFQSFPAVRKWHKGAQPSEFHRIEPATRVFRPEHPLDIAYGAALHTVTTCDLSDGGFDCKATSVIGPPGRVFYVSPEAVYVWVTGSAYTDGQVQQNSQLYRMPLDGSNPSAVGVSGSPVDQFSFLESEDGYLNVLVRSAGVGDAMWRAERVAGGVSLLRMPLTSFNDGSEPVEASSYEHLPTPGGYAFQNRFVGDYLLYGTGSGWGEPLNAHKRILYAVRWASGDVHPVGLTHGIDRIEQMGEDAVIVGTDGTDLHFSAVSLDSLDVRSEYVRKGASQGELRSHGFFYKPDGRDSGMLGLPISVPGRAGYRHLFENSAAILFLRNRGSHFQEVGELEARPEKAIDDACRASCVDWYGNSQPLFVHGRIIALLGYELVEGEVDGGRIQETRRVNYAPRNESAWWRPYAGPQN